MTDSDELFLKLALALAEGGRLTCAPNPTVGCVIVRDGQIIGKGWHSIPGQGHAEVQAMADAGGPEKITGATVYVSLEPCAYVGRTPACAKTLVDAGVARVVVATLDPHAKVSGAGMQILERAGIATANADWPEARELIAGYVLRETAQRPFVRLKTASTLDGATALANGDSQWITGEAARADVQYWRARSDAIITGVGTVLSDDPALTVRAPEYEHAKAPLRVVLDSALRTPLTAQLVTDGLPTLILHDAAATAPAYAQPVECEVMAPRNLPAILQRLAKRGCNEVLVEAGAAVVGSFVEQNLWDEWICYLAPGLFGTATRPLGEFVIGRIADAPRTDILRHDVLGQDLRLTLRPAVV